ncbi:MAG: sulfotransferase family protein [Janthinobacterium lividum]
MAVADEENMVADSTRPTAQIIDITDLRTPVLTDIQRGALQAAAAIPVTFTRAAILDAATVETGLSDFGNEDFLERLDIWLQAIDEDENASALTRLNLFQMTIRYAATRLRVEDIVRRHPEILDIVIDRPIIVAGLPRSGTTHLLDLLSADNRLRSLPWWEAIAPVPAPGDEPGELDANPRHTRAEAGWQGFEAVLPYMKVMHEFSADHISEDIELQALDFSSYLIEWLAYVPRWRDYYLSHDQAGSYAYLKKGLQVLTHLRGPNRWVIKCPQHMEQLPVLYRTFPDATFVLTHRDPVGSVRSAMTMALYAARVLRRRVDPAEPADYWIDRYQRLLRACVRDRDCLPEAQTLDIYFHEWIKNPDLILREIYRKAGLPLTDATLAEIHARRHAHDNGQPVKLVYDLHRDFGLDAATVRSSFDFYFARFPVRIEVE